MSHMRLAVVGSRDFPFEWMVRRYLHDLPVDEIISGGARGVDTWAEQWAEDHEVGATIYRADWDKYGKSAGYRRNADIVNTATHLVAFQYNASRGTQHSIDLARERGIPVRVIRVE